VLGDVDSLREVWSDAAVFVDPNDSDALKTALRKLIDNASQRHEMARRARERAREFTSDRMGQNYFAAYVELFDAHARKEEMLARCA
jgi:glycosyltransferase involved in cell wall biosynthesis